MATRLYSYNPHSQSASRLAQALNIRRIRHENTRVVIRRDDQVINWGSSSIPVFNTDPVGLAYRYINGPSAVSVVGNKLSFFQLNHTARLPAFGTTRDWALNEIRNGGVVVCRTSLTGHSGRGIIIAEVEHQLVDAPLYTRYVKKQSEYRIHIVRGEVVDVQRKIRDPDREPTNWRVRSHQNGFIYVRDGFELPSDCRVQALLAFEVSGLDFGAVDVVWNEHEERAYVLEINTAPGLTGTTVTNYAEAFREHFLVQRT